MNSKSSLTFFCFKKLIILQIFFVVVGDPTQDANQMPGVGQLTNAYVQMVNRGDSHKASSPDCRVLTPRQPPIAGQAIR